jgi:hypothetical protein
MVSRGGIRKLPGYENYWDTKTTGIQKLPGYKLKPQRSKLEERTHKFRQENLAV